MQIRLLRKVMSARLLLVVILGGLLAPLTVVVPAYAAASFTWKDATSVINNSDGNTFVQRGKVFNGGTVTFEQPGSIQNGPPITTTGPTMILVDTAPSNKNGCDKNGPDIYVNGKLMYTEPSAQSALVIDLFRHETTAASLLTPDPQAGCQVFSSPATQAVLTAPLDSYVVWTSATTMTDLAFGNNVTFTENLINGPTMSLPASCSTSTTITVGDLTNSFGTATTASLSGFLPDPDGTDLTCGSKTVRDYSAYPLTIINGTYPGAVGQWLVNQYSPSNNIYPAITTSGGAYNNALWVLSGTLQPTDTDMTLVERSPVAPCATAATMVINNYHTATSATVTKGSCTPVVIIPLTNTYDSPNSGPPPPPNSNGTPCENDPNDQLKWAVCPVTDGISNALNSTVSKLIAGFLTIQVDAIFGDGGYSGLFSIFRNIGAALLVIAGLVMVVSQAADLDIFSAYTIRKVLPRLIIAAIGMSLSWPLLQFIIGFFNDLGNSIGTIILQASGSSLGKGYSGPPGDAIAAFVGTIVALVGSELIHYGWYSLLSLLIFIAIFVLVAFAVLALRLLAVLLCVVTAPLAIAAWVLPGTEKLWRFWKDTLLGALIMFPLIMAFLATGAAMADLSYGIANQTDNEALKIMSIFLYFIPYLMIPFAFRLAGGIMGRAYDFINGSGVVQGRRKGIAAKRQHLGEENMRKTWTGTRFSKRNVATRRFNDITAGLATGPTALWGFRRKRAKGIIALKQAVAGSQAAKNPLMQQLGFDDDANAAMFASEGRGGWAGERAARKHLLALHGRDWLSNKDMRLGVTTDRDKRINQAIATARMVGFNYENWIASAQTLAANKARSIGAGQDALDEITKILDEGTTGNDQLRGQIAGNMGVMARDNGATTLAALASSKRGVSPTLEESWFKTHMYQLGKSDDANMQAHLDSAVDRFMNPQGPNQQVRDAVQQQAAIQLLEAQNLLAQGQVPASVQNIINDAMETAGYGDAQRRGGSAEDFLASRLRAAGINTTGDALRSMARVPDSLYQQRVGQSQGQGNPQQPGQFP